MCVESRVWTQVWRLADGEKVEGGGGLMGKFILKLNFWNNQFNFPIHTERLQLFLPYKTQNVSL